MGNNIRRERISRNMSIDELAELLELTPGFVGLIERGQRGATPQTLTKLSNVFGISIDSFFAGGDGKNLSVAEEPELGTHKKRKKILSLISDLPEKELDFVIQIVKATRAMSNPKEVLAEDE